MLKINGVDLPVLPRAFSVKIMDLDDAETTTRTADGRLNRTRIAVKRQIEMTWGPLFWADTAAILQTMQDEFFEVTYPDPMTGQEETGTFYAGDRPAPFALAKDGDILWIGLQVTLIER